MVRPAGQRDEGISSPPTLVNMKNEIGDMSLPRIRAANPPGLLGDAFEHKATLGAPNDVATRADEVARLVV